MSANTPAPVASKNALTNCHCLTGTELTCPATTRKAFAQGHDARMSSRIATAIAEGAMTEQDGLKLIRQAGGGDLLVAKTKHSAALRKSKGTEPKAPKAPKAAKPAIEVPAAPSIVGEKVQVFHGKRPFNSIVVKDAAGQLVARHRLNGKDCNHEVAFEDGEIFTK